MVWILIMYSTTSEETLETIIFTTTHVSTHPFSVSSDPHNLAIKVLFDLPNLRSQNIQIK